MTLTSPNRPTSAEIEIVDDAVLKNRFASSPAEAAGRIFLVKDGASLFVRKLFTEGGFGKTETIEALHDGTMHHKIALWTLMAHGVVKPVFGTPAKEDKPAVPAAPLRKPVQLSKKHKKKRKAA